MLAVGGAVAVGTGLVHIAGGVATFPGSPSADAAADNEARFLAASWVGFGVLALWAVSGVEHKAAVVRTLGGVLILGGLARAVSLIDVGDAETLQDVLMGIELVLGLMLVAWPSFLRGRE